MPKAPTPGTISVANAAPVSVMQKKLKFATRALQNGQDGAMTQQAKLKAKKAAAGKKNKDNTNASTGGNGMVFDKGHGQHILKNPLVIQAIVEKAGVKSTDVVVEIGPGTGNLTEKLLQTAKKVYAFEIDPRMVAELHKRFQSSPLRNKLEIIRGNCLDHDFPAFDRCVANVPYAISSALVFKLLRNPNFKCAVLMFQREFAMRVCAPPGSELYCRLSVNSQLLARCSHLIKVSKNSFTPPPKVESSVIRLDPKHPQPDVDFDEWDGLVKMLFNRKNKKVTSLFRTKTALQQLYDTYVSYARMEAKEKSAAAEAEGKKGKAAAVAPEILPPEAFKALLDNVLENEIMSMRSRTMTEEDILQVLGLFNRNGIRFA